METHPRIDFRAGFANIKSRKREDEDEEGGREALELGFERQRPRRISAGVRRGGRARAIHNRQNLQQEKWGMIVGPQKISTETRSRDLLLCSRRRSTLSFFHSDCTVWIGWMSHRKWKTGLCSPFGPLFHFHCDIHLLYPHCMYSGTPKL